MFKYKAKNIHLEGRGVEKVLGELEAKIMNLIWRSGAATVRKVCDGFSRQKKEISFNAIMTVMNRLVQKGLLKKKSQEGGYVYRAAVREEDFSRSVARDIISAVVKDPELFSASGFAELAEELDKETLRRLKDITNKKKT